MKSLNRIIMAKPMISRMVPANLSLILVSLKSMVASATPMVILGVSLEIMGATWVRLMAIIWAKILMAMTETRKTDTGDCTFHVPDLISSVALERARCHSG